jgi:hypothetical protein
MGDFNAKVGCNNEDVEHVMSKHGTRDCNENGELLIETCGNHGLMIGGTFVSSQRMPQGDGCPQIHMVELRTK